MQVEWYFDVISPFAYLQAEQLCDWLPAANIRATPVVLGALLSHWETRGPAEIPIKRVQTYRSALWRAEALDLPFRFPPAHPFDPLPLLRLCIAAGGGFEPAREVLRFVWREGRSISESNAIDDLGHRLGILQAAEAVSSPEVKLALRANTERAMREGIFGVPALRVGGEVFWGEDATEMARRTCEIGPAWLGEGEWLRTTSLPVAVQRKT